MRAFCLCASILMLATGCTWTRDRIAAHDANQRAKWAEKVNAGTCPIHDKPMTRSEVPIAYGLFLPEDGEFRSPFQGYLPGGCIVGEQKSTNWWICDSCVADGKYYSHARPYRPQPEPFPKRSF